MPRDPSSIPGLVHSRARDAETTGTVEPNLVEFKIPHEQPASATWNWNRPETPDNDGEYIWQVAVPSGSGRYSFGFYLYKSGELYSCHSPVLPCGLTTNVSLMPV